MRMRMRKRNWGRRRSFTGVLYIGNVYRANRIWFKPIGLIGLCRTGFLSGTNVDTDENFQITSPSFNFKSIRTLLDQQATKKKNHKQSAERSKASQILLNITSLIKLLRDFFIKIKKKTNKGRDLHIWTSHQTRTLVLFPKNYTDDNGDQSYSSDNLHCHEMRSCSRLSSGYVAWRWRRRRRCLWLLLARTFRWRWKGQVNVSRFNNYILCLRFLQVLVFDNISNSSVWCLRIFYVIFS